tara:strand:+ start:252 stop:1253 length:1002 start_codon:yes stop_codon:yes gene_type:complete
MIHISTETSNTLEETVFNKHHSITECDELRIVSGYVGPEPINKLNTLPFKSKVFYGMYGEAGIDPSLHKTICAIDNSSAKISVFYSKLKVHSKIYLWLNRGRVVSGLSGSANFSNQGLLTLYREILSDLNAGDFRPVLKYATKVANKSISCFEHIARPRALPSQETSVMPTACSLTLLNPSTGEVHETHGLNWGQGTTNHTTRDDACIPIRVGHIRDYPDLFFPKPGYSTSPGGRLQRQSDPIEVIFDDGFVMAGSMEGNNYPYPIDQGDQGPVYPKQLTSFPDKGTIGKYFRDRLSVPHGQPVRKHHLESYGRKTIDFSVASEGVYKLDFSV